MKLHEILNKLIVDVLRKEKWIHIDENNANIKRKLEMKTNLRSHTIDIDLTKKIYGGNGDLYSFLLKVNGDRVNEYYEYLVDFILPHNPKTIDEVLDEEHFNTLLELISSEMGNFQNIKSRYFIPKSEEFLNHYYSKIAEKMVRNDSFTK